MRVPLVRDQGLERWLRERFAGFAAGPMPVNNLRQADVPKGARIIANERGSAPASRPTYRAARGSTRRRACRAR